MNIAKEKTGACRWKVMVDVPADRVQAEYENVLKIVMQDAEVDGFRRGRAPRAVVENKYSTSILEEVKNALVRQAFQEVRQQQNLDVIYLVDVEEPAILMGQPARFVFTVDVAPTFDLPEYRNIPVKTRAVQVSPEEVAAVKQNVLRQREHWEKVEERAVQAGDLVITDYEGVCDGTPVVDLGPRLSLMGKGESIPIIADDASWLPGLGRALIGARVGERREVWVEFPDSFEDSALARKKCTYFVQIKEIQQRKMDPPDEAFYARFGVKTDAELEDKIREELRKSKEDNARVEQKNQIYQFLLQRLEMELPQSEVDEAVQRAVYEQVDALASSGRQKDLTDEERDELVKRATAIGMMRVKLRYILRRIAKAEHVEVKPEEVHRVLASMALSQGGSAKDLKKVMQQPKAYEEVYDMVLSKKVSDWLLSQAKVETVTEEEKKS